MHTRIPFLTAVAPSQFRHAVTTAGLGAGLAPYEEAAFIFDRLAAQAVILAAGASLITTELVSLRIPRITGDVTSQWLAEATAITPADPAGDFILSTPRKLTALTAVSNELVTDSTPEALDVIGANIARSMALRFDLSGFEGTGTAPEIRGLRNVAGIGSGSFGANGATPANLDLIADAIGTINTANGEPTAIFMHPRTWQTFSKVKEVSGSTKPVLVTGMVGPTGRIERSIYGVPVYLSSQMSIAETQGSSVDCSSIYVAQMDQIVVVQRREIEVEMSTDVRFNSDETLIRAIGRFDVVHPNPGAIVRIVGARP